MFVGSTGTGFIAVGLAATGFVTGSAGAGNITVVGESAGAGTIGNTGTAGTGGTVGTDLTLLPASTGCKLKSGTDGSIGFAELGDLTGGVSGAGLINGGGAGSAGTSSFGRIGFGVGMESGSEGRGGSARTGMVSFGTDGVGTETAPAGTTVASAMGSGNLLAPEAFLGEAAIAGRGALFERTQGITGSIFAFGTPRICGLGKGSAWANPSQPPAIAVLLTMVTATNFRHRVLFPLPLMMGAPCPV